MKNIKYQNSMLTMHIPVFKLLTIDRYSKTSLL